MSVTTHQNLDYSLSQLSAEKIELLKRTICKGGSNEDLELLIHACNRMGLDPFMRQIYSIPRRDYKTGLEIRTIQTGIDGYRLIAERTGKYMPGRQCTFSYGKDGNLLNATAYVKKLGPDHLWHEIEHTVFWNEYAAMKDGKPIAMWKDKPHVMLGKCAESACLRKAFPADLSGLYTKEEMEHADIDVEPIQKEVARENREPEELISNDEAIEIENLLSAEDKTYREDLLKYFTSASKSQTPLVSFHSLPKRFYSGCMKSIMKRREERLKKAETQEVKYEEAEF